MKLSSSLHVWRVWPVIAAFLIGVVSITGCGQQQVAGVGTGGTGSNQYAMGGAIQGKALALTNTVTTIAGNTTTVAGTPGSTDGTGVNARFNAPSGITTDGTNLYVTDTFNYTIRKVVIATGTVTTLAGTAGVSGSRDGIGSAATFGYLSGGIATDGTNLYVTDSSMIRKVAIATGEVTTLAGSPGQFGTADGIGAAARFLNPIAMATDGTNLYVTDRNSVVETGYSIRKIVIATGEVSTLVRGVGVQGWPYGNGAQFYWPAGITTDGTNLFIFDSGNNSVRRIVLATGEVTTLGSAVFSYPANQAIALGALVGMATDGTNLYLTDNYNSIVLKMEIATGTVSTLAGAFTQGATDGTGPAAGFNRPMGITSDGTNLYVADTGNNSIRRIVIASGAVTTLAGPTAVDGIGADASFFWPLGTTTDGKNLFVTEPGRTTIRKIDLATGEVTSLPGGPAWGITTDGVNLYVTDLLVIRKVEIATGNTSILAGSANTSGAADGIGAAARFGLVSGITTDKTNLYVTDRGNGTIRKIEIATGRVTTLAGTAGSFGSADGVGAAATFKDILSDITTDGTSLYVADTDLIRKIVIATGAVTTLAGQSGWQAGGVGTATGNDMIGGITTDGTNLYVTHYDSTIRKVVIATGEITTVAGTPGVIGSSDGTGPAASFNMLAGITTDGNSLYVADSGNNTIRRIQ